MDKAGLSKKVEALNKNGKISCKQALKLAEEEGGP